MTKFVSSIPRPRGTHLGFWLWIGFILTACDQPISLPTMTMQSSESTVTVTVPSVTPTIVKTASPTNTQPIKLNTLAEIAAMPVPESDLRQIAIRTSGHQNIPVTVSSHPSDHHPGDIITFSATNLDTDKQFFLAAEMVYAGPLVLFFAEPHLEVQREDVQPLLDNFQQIIIPTVRKFFGHEWSPGIDGDPRIYILYAEDLGNSVAGYYSSTDEYSRLAHEYSNEKEMFYLNADIISLDDPGLAGTLAHEFQHMIHWAHDSNEETWMNEGSSVLAELLTGHTPQRFDLAFGANPDVQLNAWSTSGGGSESVQHYGAAFLFLYYYLERFGETATRALVAHQDNGLAAMDAALQELNVIDPLSGNPVRTDTLFADWVVANYIGDTSWADGRFGYHEYSGAPYDIPIASLKCVSPISEMGVHQYAADYITVDCPNATSVSFSGAEEVHVVPTEAHSGDFMFWGNRQDSSDTTLTRQFDLTQVSTAHLSYWTWWQLEENYDYAYLMVSSNNGNSWQIIKTPSGTGEDLSGNNLGWGYHYNSGGASEPVWLQEHVALSAFAGKQILVRFEYLTDAAINWPGILLDDISVPEIGYSEDFESGTGGWESHGWVRFDNVLPQRWLIQVIDRTEQSVRRVEAMNGSADIDLSNESTIVISALTPFTTEIAHYRLEMKLE